MLALSDIKQGESYTIKWMLGIPEALELLQNLQIREGSVVRIIKKYKDCMEIHMTHKVICGFSGSPFLMQKYVNPVLRCSVPEDLGKLRFLPHPWYCDLFS